MFNQETRGIRNKRRGAGVCYAIIPENVDRDTYVKDCMRRGIIAALFDDGAVSFNVRVGMSVLPLIDFPLTTQKLGSALVYVNEYNHNNAIVIDRLIKDDEASPYSENEFRFEKNTANGSVSILGTAKDGNLFIKVLGNTDAGGKIFVDVGNTNNTGGVVLNITGDLKTEMQNFIVNLLAGMNLKATGDVLINSDTKIKLGNSANQLDPVLLGNKTIEQLNKEVQAITNLLQTISTIVPLAVTSGLVDGTWAAWQSAVALAITQRGDYSQVASQKVFTE
jgi:hypothetical protein